MMPLEILQYILQAIVRGAMTLLTWSSPKSLPPTLPTTDPIDGRSSRRSLQTLADEVDRVFRYPCSMKKMLAMSQAMKRQYEDKLQTSDICMLPTYCTSLPRGQEQGKFVALDVGGSTFRVALVELHGRQRSSGESMTIQQMTSTKIDESIRRLAGVEFFDWMAARIQEVLNSEGDITLLNNTVPLGLTWSFPIEQTSHRSGRMQGMGKGFRCAQDTLGQDLAELLETACARNGMSVRVDAIVNDGAATLLSEAYADPSTSMGLIMGTGTNAAVYLPTSAIGRSKFGRRNSIWFGGAERVIVNTELSMFGKDILPQTIWDESLNKTHTIPDFQPLEYMTTGRYLGELMRLIMVDAVESCGLFGGLMPLSLLEPYTLDTAILSKLEEDISIDLKESISMIAKEFQLKLSPTTNEVAFLRLVAQSISLRASAYLAVAIHALWSLQKETDINPHTPFGTPKTSIACNGSVILKYPGVKTRCEKYVEQMIKDGSASGLFRAEKVVLKPTNEAAVLGAAVAVAMEEIP
jgi:hexokinase